MDFKQFFNSNQLKNLVNKLESSLIKKYDIKLHLIVYPESSTLKLDNIIVPKDKQKQGIGSQVLQEITDFADNNQLKMILTLGVKDPSTGTTSKERLRQFYTRFGFKKNQDPSITASMVRNPKLVDNSKKSDIDEGWEQATYGNNYKLTHVNDGRWGGIAVGPIAKKSFNTMKENMNHLFTEESTFKIFCDMDGVLTNFNKNLLYYTNKNPRIVKKLGKLNSIENLELNLKKWYEDNAENEKDFNRAKSKAKGCFWSSIQGNEDFWTNMEWMPDGKELWDYLKQLKQNNKISQLNILSSPSSDPLCESGKRKWIEKQNLNADIIIIDRDKFKFATGKNDILIDDTKKKITDWIEKGNGTGILHINTNNTIEQLKGIL